MAQIDIPKPCCQLHHTFRRMCLHGIWQINWQLHMYEEILTNFAPPRHPVPLWGARSPKSRTEIFSPHTHTGKYWSKVERWIGGVTGKQGRKRGLGTNTGWYEQKFIAGSFSLLFFFFSLSPYMMSFFMHDWVLTTFCNDWEGNDCSPLLLFTVMWIRLCRKTWMSTLGRHFWPPTTLVLKQESLNFAHSLLTPVGRGAGGILEAKRTGPNGIFWLKTPVEKAKTRKTCVRAASLCHPSVENTWLKMTTCLRRWTKRKRKERTLLQAAANPYHIFFSPVSLPAILGDYNIFRRATCTSSCRSPVNGKIYGDGMCRSLMNVQYSHDSI